MTFLPRTMGIAAVAALTLAPLAQAYADVVTVFDSNSSNPALSSWTATGLGSSTSGGATTIQNNPSSETNYITTDYFNLGSAVHTGSGIWTLTTTVTNNIGNQVSAGVNDLNFWGGFGNINNTADSLGYGGGGGATGKQVGAPSFEGQRNSSANPPLGQSTATNPANVAYQTMLHSGSAPGGAALNGSYSYPTLTNAQIQAIEAQSNAYGASDTQTFKLVLNTNNSHWTVQFFVNGQAEQFLLNGQLTDTLVYATDPTISAFGIGAWNVGGTFGESTLFSNTTLTDDTGSVAAVPEASTWAMMVAGFAGLGFLSYRRSRRNGTLNFRFA